MSAMSELDLMITEYEAARADLAAQGGFGTIDGYIAAANKVVAAADVLVGGLRSILAGNG